MSEHKPITEEELAAFEKQLPPFGWEGGNLHPDDVRRLIAEVRHLRARHRWLEAFESDDPAKALHDLASEMLDLRLKVGFYENAIECRDRQLEELRAMVKSQ